MVVAAGLAQPTLEALVDFLDGFGSAAIPDEVLEQGRRMLLDTIGCTIGGTASTPGNAFVAAFGSWAGGGVADILGTGIRTSPLDAAYVNAYLGDVLDFEETLVSHPSAVIVAAALSVGQHVRATGEQVLRASIAGYEVGSRVGRAVTPSPSHAREAASEFWWKSISAVVTAGLLLGLRGDQWVHAFGYATSASPAARRGGFEFRPLSWLKANYPGQAHSGVVAAYLASTGFETYRGMLDGHRTFAQLLGSDRWQPELVTAELGNRWDIAAAGFKAYPACLYLHPLLDAIAAVRRERPFNAQEVASVRLMVPKLISSEMDVRRPASVIDAQFSAPYAAATLIFDPDEPGPDWISDARLTDPALLAILDRIVLIQDPNYTALYADDRRVRSGVNIRFTDGTAVEQHVSVVHGSATDPLSTDYLRAKFGRMVASAIDADATVDVIVMIDQIETLTDINTLVERLRPTR